MTIQTRIAPLAGAALLTLAAISADAAEITITGVGIHPAIAKDRMLSAIRAAGRFIDRLPPELSPERTDASPGDILTAPVVRGRVPVG